MLPYQNKNQPQTPYAWQSGDTSTFSQQAQNLGQQVGNQGLDTDLIDVQKQTAQAKQKAGQSAENVAGGASQVANGAVVDPTVAQSNTIQNTTGIANPKIEPYKIINQAPAAPSTDVNPNTDFSGFTNLQDPTQAYLQKLFPQGIPSSVQDALNNIQSDPQDTLQYQNFIQNALSNQQQNLGQEYENRQNDIGTQNSTQQKAISDYINQLNTGLQTYQKNTQDLGNIGQLSDAEQTAAANNAILAAPGSGIDALSALSHGNMGNRNLAALTQQAQNAAIQEAEGKAGAAQAQDKSGENMLEQGQKDMQNAYGNAATSITNNQNNLLDKLQKSDTAAEQALSDAYNNAKTNLNNQEQQYVNKAQSTLKSANVSPTAIQSATGAFANTVQNYINNNKLSQQQKQNLGNQLESVWRIAVGSHPTDINYSNQIASSLIPILQNLGFGNNQKGN